MKRVIGIIGLVLANVFFWAWAAITFTLDWVGRSTVIDDFSALQERLPAILQWVYANTPWWTPTALGASAIAFLVWLSWPSSSSGSGDERRPSNAFKETLFRAELAKAHRAFRAVDEHIRLGGVPSSIPRIEEQVARFRSLEISLEKHGIKAPWLDYKTDPVGYFQRNTEYLNSVVPMVNDGHLPEAKKAAKALSSQLQIQHPGTNGRKALQ
jgi:hypothetical protein